MHDRDNRGLTHLPKDLVRDGFLLLNSSYTQANDPNTMRDFGPNRNVVYRFEADSDPSARDGLGFGREAEVISGYDRGSAMGQTAMSFNLQPMPAPNPAFLGKKIHNVEKEAASRQAILRRRLGYTSSDMNDNGKIKGPNDDPYDEFYTVVKANDYTKNISEPLFSAGLVADGYTERMNQALTDKASAKRTRNLTKSVMSVVNPVETPKRPVSTKVAGSATP